jgi:hypothetical protein
MAVIRDARSGGKHMSDLRHLQDAIFRTHGVRSTHVASARVSQTLQGQALRDGVVEVFELRNHPRARFCYAWSFRDDSGGTAYATVLKTPPVDSASDAVRSNPAQNRPTSV